MKHASLWLITRSLWTLENHSWFLGHNEGKKKGWKTVAHACSLKKPIGDSAQRHWVFTIWLQGFNTVIFQCLCWQACHTELTPNFETSSSVCTVFLETCYSQQQEVERKTSVGSILFPVPRSCRGQIKGVSNMSIEEACGRDCDRSEFILHLVKHSDFEGRRIR